MIKSGKEYLEYTSERIWYLQEKIEREKDRIETIEANMNSVGAIGYEERVQTTPDGDKYSSMIDEIAELNESIVKAETSIKTITNKLIKYLDCMGNNQLRDCLKYRYVDGMNVNQIAMVEGIGERGLRKRFVRAYKLFDNIYALEMYRKNNKSVDSSSVDVLR